MNREDLTPRQLEVVESTDRTVLVTGGAGTGKTTVALWAARAELERHGNENKRALFLTFSRTAVDQIMARSRNVVAPVEDRIEVSTFHSFAYRLVRRFGFMAGLTPRNPMVQSASEVKLLGKDPDRLVYDDLAPLAKEVFNDARVASLLSRRWCMVICDEFQDTGDSQWEILEWLSRHSRLILLGDEHQLIYGFLASTGVVPERMIAARSSVERVVELEPRSHRDPSGAVPALANAIRSRAFDHPAVLEAVSAARLQVRAGVDEANAIEAIGTALDAAWERGCRSFGVFAHTNQSVAALAFRLHEAGIDHYLVGLPDAEADALTAMLAITRYAYGEAAWSEAAVALATFLTACSRGKHPPRLAVALANGESLPSTLETRVRELQSRAVGAASSSLLDVADVVATSWQDLGIASGEAPWRRSSPAFQAIVREASSDPVSRTANLQRAIANLRVGAMFESQRRRLPSVQVMNLHQTKGREADAIIILSGDEDFHGYESEPFVEGSRLLYVTLTRARREITVILGDEPHPLFAPFAHLA